MNDIQQKVLARVTKLKAMAERGSEYERRNANEILETMYVDHPWLKTEQATTDRLNDFVHKWNARQRADLKRKFNQGSG